MKKHDYLPRADADRAIWLVNFEQKAKDYQVILNLSPATIAQLETDSDIFAGTLLFVEQLRNKLEAATAFKNQLRDGTGTLVPPILPTLPPIPPTVQSGIFNRVRLLVQTIKAHPNYTESIGDDMRIIGEESTDDPNTWKPILGVRLESGRPNILWKKGHSEGIKLWVDRGTGFEFLAIDTRPDYIDNEPLPPLGQSAVWKYQARYLLNDETVGLVSDVLDVTVTGENT